MSLAMKNATITDHPKLARLTGLPNLANIHDPERLERLVDAAWSALTHTTTKCPLRVKAALKEYAEAASHRLEHPEELL